MSRTGMIRLSIVGCILFSAHAFASRAEPEQGAPGAKTSATSEAASPQETPAGEESAAPAPAETPAPAAGPKESDIGHMDFVILVGANILLSPDRFNAMDKNGELAKANTISLKKASFDDATAALMVGFALRYRAPESVPLLFQIGYDALYTPGAGKGAAIISKPLERNIHYDNIAMEVPLLMGAYWKAFDTGLYLWGAIGPTFGFFMRSYWDMDKGDTADEGLNDYNGDGKVGAYFVFLGLDYFPVQSFGLSLTCLYRYLQSGKLSFRDQNNPKDQAPDMYLDFSGIELNLNIRIGFF